MRILACDPGYDRLGVAVLDKNAGKEQLLYSNCITTDKSESPANRLTTLGAEFSKLLDIYSPDAVALESLFFNKNVKTALLVAEARGVLLFLAHTAKCTIYEYTPQEIKVATTGYGKSDKKQVTDMVRRLLPGVPEKALDDEYDAIAVGLTALASIR